MEMQPMPGATLLGSTTPRIFTKPKRELTEETSKGFAAIMFATVVLRWKLVPWQAWFLIHALELNPDGSFRFRTVILLVARQNGKSAVMKIAALFRLFADPECKVVLGMAQNLKIATKTWREAVTECESIPALRDHVANVRRGNGDQELELYNGSSWFTAAATREGSRGFTVDQLLLDELREHQDWEAWNAATGTTMARAHAQVWGVSNAGDSKSVVLRALREGAMENLEAGGAMGLFEWSAPEGCELDDRTGWQAANPSLGFTLAESTLEAALEVARSPKGSEAGFRTEHLCQWVTTMAKGPWEDGVWDAAADKFSSIADGNAIALAIDVSHDLRMGYIGIAGRRPDGKAHVEVIAQRAGTDWLVPHLVKHWPGLQSHGVTQVYLQGKGPAGRMGEFLEADGIPVYRVDGSDITASFAPMLEGIASGKVRHLAQPVLDEAGRTAQTKHLGGDNLVIDRGKSPTDAAPLMAVSLAHWGLLTHSIRAEAPKQIQDFGNYEPAVTW